MDAKEIPAGEFKQHCLRILDQVADTHSEVVITKRGRPVAKLVPLASDEDVEQAILSRLRERCRVLVSEEEFLEPSTADAGWELHDENEE